MTLTEVIQLLGRGAQVVESGADDPGVQWMLVALQDGSRLLVVERTYREGLTTVVDPTDEEIASCRRDPWILWNSRGPEKEGSDE